MPMNLSLGLGLGGIPVSEGVGGFSLDAYMASLSDGLYFDATKTDRFFQENTGPTLADDVGEAIGLAMDQRTWGGQTLAEVLAAATELVVNGNFSVGTGWTLLSGWAISGGAAVVTAAAAYTSASQAFGFVAGKTYQVTYDVVAASAGSVRPVFLNGTQTTGTARTAPGTYTELLVAQAGNNSFAMQAGSGGFTGSIDNVSVKLIPGNHGLQATGTLKPVRQTTGAKFDGWDDYLSTLVQPGSGPNFSVALLTVPASLGGFQYAFGSTDGTNRFGYGFNPDGTVGFGFGTTSPIAAKGTTDTRGTEVVVGMSSDGVDALGFVGAEQEYAAALAGSMNNGRAFYLGAVNGVGIVTNFFGGSIKKLVAGRDHLSLSRYQQIRTALLSA